MKAKIPINNPSSRSSGSGFALIATLSVIALVVILVMGLLSLSQSSLRRNTQDKARAEAQANARMSIALAIGALQKSMGPDQRISANGAILSTEPVRNPHWTGVWNAWKAGVGEKSQHGTIGTSGEMAPTYEPNRKDFFREWLVSLDPLTNPLQTVTNLETAKELGLVGESMPMASSKAVTLVGEGSLGSSAKADHVSAGLLSTPAAEGGKRTRIAWWVGDESQKARIMGDSYETGTSSLTMAEKILRSQAPGSMGNKTVPGLEGMTSEPQLGKIPTFETLDLVSVNPKPAAGAPEVSRRNFHHATINSQGVLADVREGGLKRDLSTILEREIKLDENGDEFMLYRFDGAGEDRVPIQDLSAYYQLHDNDPSWASSRRGGIEHNASPSRVMQVKAPDHGNDSSKDKFLREYTSLYRNPVPIRVQFVLGVGATGITATERAAILARGIPLRESDKYKMLLGVKPVVSLWNPNNTPLVMGTDASQIMKVGFPPFTLRWKKYRADGLPAEYQSVHLNLNYAISNESTGDGRARSLGPYIMQLQFAKDSPIVFQPGEVKMFSIPIAGSNFLESGGNSTFGNTPLYQAQEFLPDGFYVTAKTVVQSNGADAVQFPNSAGSFINYQGWRMVFGDGDHIDLEVEPENGTSMARSVSSANEITGSGFQFFMSDVNYVGGQAEHYRNYQFISRFGGSGGANNPNASFNRTLMLAGFPGGAVIPYQGQTNALPGSEIKSATDNGEAKGLLLFTMMPGAEVHNTNSPGAGAGRRITTRPFLHGSTLSAPQIVDNTRSALYDYGWEWQVERINEVEEAFQDDGAGRGYYGGGYTVGEGVTHVVQQYLPALPPISIASLSSAHLGGFSLANNTILATPSAALNHYVFPPGNTNYPFAGAPLLGDLRQITATGQGGLAPRMLQAIGNSYAHPNIPADKAFTTYTQLLNSDINEAQQIRPYADHSYLANKALWDEFFFSSIAPQPGRIPLYGGSNKTAQDVAGDFLFNGKFLSNRRFVPYTTNLDLDEFTALKSQWNVYANGFADKIASHMMVDGPFNINSTSVAAWKVLFSSLKGKPLAYLEDNASRLATITPDHASVAPGMLANGRPINGSDLGADPNDPPEQWTSSRGLSDQEIDELAIAMVEQVRKRGPFLSLSEFINRRLDGGNKEFALKGALQAAIDDRNVSINAAFRTPERSLDGGGGGAGETSGMTAAFTEALQGPIAYGSTPYVDQADILRHMGSILTPRGDTFVIRAYGDSLDALGKVVARAWCEVVVQRLPDYVDPLDAQTPSDTGDTPETRQANLASVANKIFGRKFRIISFRWLDANEI